MERNNSKIKILKTKLEEVSGRKVVFLKEAFKIPVFKKQTVIEDNKVFKLIDSDSYYDAHIPFNTDKVKGKKFKIKTVWGELVFSPIFNGKISTFLDNQTSGSIDLQVPIATKTKDYVIVYVGDGAAGDYLIITPVASFNKAQVCQLIIEHSNLIPDEGDEDDDW